MLDDLKRKSLRAFLWSMSDSVGVAAVSLVSFVVLARILDPRDFGAVALAGVFVYFLNLLAYHSFTDALVQRSMLEAQHLDSGFWGGVALAVVLMLLCQAGATPLAALLGEPTVAPVLKLLAIGLPLSALGGVQAAMFRREMQFRPVAAAFLAGRVTGAGVGVAMALLGCGIWSLVGQQVVGAGLSSLVLWMRSRWRPGFAVSRRHLRELAGFGMHVSASQVLIGAAGQLVNLLVGTLLGSVALGYFSIAARTVQLLCSLTSGAVYHVSFSAFSRLQHDRAALARALTQATRISCLIGVPAGIGMALVADLLVEVLYGAKWEQSGLLLAIMALQMIPMFFGMFFTACYRALSRPSWVAYIAGFELAATLAGLLALTAHGIVAVTIFATGRFVLEWPIHFLLLRRLLGMDLRRFLRPLLEPMAAAAPMAAAVAVVRWTLVGDLDPLPLLAACMTAGALSYAAAAWLISPGLSQTAIGLARGMRTPAEGTG